MELKLKRCTIRDYLPSDANSLAKHANNRKIWLGLRDAFPHPYTIHDANKFLAGSIPGLPRLHFCIDIGGEAVGGIGLRPGEDVHRHTAELGYWIAEEFWGQGLMSEIVPAFVSHSFEEFSFTRIFAMPHSSNPASVRVLEKAGFQFEGRLQNHVIKDGEILDSLLYATTR